MKSASPTNHHDYPKKPSPPSSPTKKTPPPATPPTTANLSTLPTELHVHILTYLRATDLSSLQRTNHTFHSPTLTHTTTLHFAHHVYPPDLTLGFDTPIVGGAVGRVRVVVDSNNNSNNNDHAEEPKGLVFGTYEALRNMEMVVVARVLMRPEPSLVERRSGSGSSSGEESGGFYVSKAWCRSALRWLECQAMERRDREVVRLNNLEEEEEERARVAAAAGASGGRKGKHHHHHHQQRKAKNNNNGGGGKKNKKSKRKERIQNRKKSDALPPSPYVNYDLLCEHGRLRSKCSSNNNNTINNNHTPNGNNNNNNNSNNNINGGGSRAKRRLMDRQAWRVLKKLYPDGVQLSSIEGECLQCALEEQTAKRNEDVRKGKETEERKKPLGCRLVRGFYTRNRGVPMARLTVGETMTTTGGRSDSSALASTMVVGKKGPSFRNGSTCPLLPGIYNVLPRSWCHRWRKYIKTGEGGRPCAPDTSACLCDEHKLPLIPTHLESYLYGETSSLLHSNGFVVSSSNSAMVGSIGGGGGEAGGSGSRGSSGGSSGSDIGTLAGLERMTVSSSRPLPQSIVGLNPIEQRTVAQRPISASSSSSSSTQRNNNDHDSMLDDLRASGLSIAEIETQRQMMHQLEEWRREQSVAYEHHHHAVASATTPTTATTSNSTTTIITSPPPTIMMSPEERRANDSAQLDRENNVVVEILTDEELTALMRWWPDVHSSYSLKFAIVESEEGGGNMDVVWTTSPCRHCDKTGRASHVEVVVRNRCRSWVGNSPAKKK